MDTPGTSDISPQQLTSASFHFEQRNSKKEESIKLMKKSKSLKLHESIRDASFSLYDNPENKSDSLEE